MLLEDLGSPVPMGRYVGPIENDFIDGFIVGSPNFLILIPVRTFTCGLSSGFRISSDELNIAVITPEKTSGPYYSRHGPMDSKLAKSVAYL